MRYVHGLALIILLVFLGYAYYSPQSILCFWENNPKRLVWFLVGYVLYAFGAIFHTPKRMYKVTVAGDYLMDSRDCYVVYAADEYSARCQVQNIISDDLNEFCPIENIQVFEQVDYLITRK